MKILLIYIDLPAGFQQSEEGWGFYSEGLASISSVLKRKGHKVSLYHLLWVPSKKQFLSRIESEKPDLIGFSVGTSDFFRLPKYTSWIKERFPVPIICGGYHPTLAPEQTLNVPGVDMVCIGEGEYPLLELCQKMERGKPLNNIKSIWRKTEKGIVKNPIRPLIENLDDLPLPDFALFDFDKLISSKIATGAAMISRGCPFNCSYCCNHAIKTLYPNSRKYTRERSPQGSIRYLEKLTNHRKGLKYISFWDNDLAYPKQWSLRFLNLYRKKIGLPFSCNLRPTSVEPEIIQALKKAGCFRAHIGVESGNKKIRAEILNRHIPEKVIKKTFSLCHKAGISTLAYNMIGLPFETPEAALETIKLNAQIKPTKALAAIFCPFPGTEAYERSIKAGLINLPIDYSQDVILKNKDFNQDQLKFFSSYFRILIKLYGLVLKLPLILREKLEKALDSLFCSHYLPYQMLNRTKHKSNNVINRTKNILRNKFPNIYIFLRNITLVRRGEIKTDKEIQSSGEVK